MSGKPSVGGTTYILKDGSTIHVVHNDLFDGPKNNSAMVVARPHTEPFTEQPVKESETHNGVPIFPDINSFMEADSSALVMISMVRVANREGDHYFTLIRSRFLLKDGLKKQDIATFIKQAVTTFNRTAYAQIMCGIPDVNITDVNGKPVYELDQTRMGVTESRRIFATMHPLEAKSLER